MRLGYAPGACICAARRGGLTRTRRGRADGRTQMIADVRLGSARLRRCHRRPELSGPQPVRLSPRSQPLELRTDECSCMS